MGPGFWRESSEGWEGGDRENSDYKVSAPGASSFKAFFNWHQF